MFLSKLRGIEISLHNQDIKTLYFSSKNELKENSYYQSVLKKYYNQHQENKKVKLRCICQDNSFTKEKEKDELILSCKNINNNYFISNTPSSSQKHWEGCLFSKGFEDLTDSDGKYKDIIFKNPDYINFKNSNEDEIEAWETRRRLRTLVYYSFCIDLISQSMSKAFNRVNSNSNSREEMNQPNYIDFIKSFESILENNNILQKNSISNSLDEYTNLDYGVIYEDILSKKDTGPTIEIELPITLKRMQKEDDNKEFPFYYNKKLKHSISQYALNEVSTAHIHSNITRGPYFFIATTRQSKDIKKIIRLFLVPIALHQGKIAFIETIRERNYATELINKKIPFIKPIQSSCFSKVSKRFVNYIDRRGYDKRAYMERIPNFIEFEKDKINIVDIDENCGEFCDDFLNKKEEQYLKEVAKSNGLYQYKKI